MNLWICAARSTCSTQKLRTVVVLRFFEDMKLEDIAHVVRAR